MALEHLPESRRNRSLCYLPAEAGRFNVRFLNDWYYFEKTEEGKEILDLIEKGKLNLFCWKGIDPKDKNQILYEKNMKQLLHSIMNHPQSRSALRSRDVHALYDGKIFWPSMKPEEVQPDESFGVREFALPNNLGEYKFNKYFNSTFKVVLSKEPLTGDKSSLNILEVEAFGKPIAYYEIPQLLVDKGLAKSLYAQIDCPELRDDYKCVSNDRIRLIEGSEVTRQFLDWCKVKLKEVLEELTNQEKKKEERRHLEDLGTFLKDITNEVSELLEEENILKPTFDKFGKTKEIVKVPTNKPGYGDDGKIEYKGEGHRKGGKEIKEAESKERKTKSKLQILLSNYDPDPLNPEKTYDMLGREPILHQRIVDVDHGIWWINSQKNYVKKIKIRDPGAMPFYFFLVKEIVLSHRMRRRFKESERYDPDGLEELNFQLIDEIFNKIVQRLGIELSVDQTTAEKIREAIKTKDRFTVPELSRDLVVDPLYITAFVNNPSNGVLENFKVVKRKTEGKGNKTNFYIRK